MASPEILVKSPTKAVEDISIEDLRHLSNDSFLMWCLTSGAKVDNNDIEFDTHRYLIPMYLDNSHHIVWRKAAQLGASIWKILRMLWWLETNQGRKAGFYFPTADGVLNLSKDRVAPLIESCPSLAALAHDDSKLNMRRIGMSTAYFYHLGGMASKDSVPLDYITFDEVRLCDPKDVDQALHRISHSPYKYKVFASTCGGPDVDIDARFKRGNQLTWVSKCGCSDGCDLAEAFPACIVNDDPRRPGDVYLRCPKCGWEIKDPQNGYYLKKNPSGDFNSYSVSQLVSKYRTPKEIWEEFTTTTNKEEFYNAALGLPYIDISSRGVTPAQLQACVNPELRWMQTELRSTKPKKLPPTAMGVDVGGTYLFVTILDINPNGTKKRVRHVEVVQSNNPDYYDSEGKQQSNFIRLREIMEEFNVGIAVIDAMPLYDQALHFAQEYPGKVFLASYSTDSKDVVQWNDRTKARASVSKAGPLLKFKYTCTLGRFTSLAYTLSEWADGNVECPPVEGLKQMARSEEQDYRNQLRPEYPLQRWFDHLPRLIRRWKEIDPDTGSGRWDWVYHGGSERDPHAAHSFNYANVALERLKRRTTVFFF